MYKLIAVTLAGLFVFLNTFESAETNSIEVSRQSSNDENRFSFAELLPAEDVQVVRASPSGMSDAEAIERALAAGAEQRANRAAAPLRGNAVANKPTETSEPTPSELWVVTGTRVNLRAGPGTGNAVVATVGYGREAELLESRNGWHQIRTSDGTTSGWIFAKFLAEELPG